MATVARISIAPVKSLGLVHPDAVDVSLEGVAGDRRFWLVDADGRLFNNKRNGPLAVIRPSWNEATKELALTFPDGETVAGTVSLGEPVDILLYGRPHGSRRVVGPWAAALSSYARQPLTLLWSDRHATDRGAIGGVITLVSRGSLVRLGEVAASTGPVDGRRFRMTLELDGLDAHEEDTWIGGSVEVGTVEVVVLGDVGRCVVTSHDPDTGRTDLDTLGALARYRPDGVSEPLPFGVYAKVQAPGRVAVGDHVRRAQASR